MAGIAGIFYWNQSYAASFYADALADAAPYETIVIGDLSYVVDHGAVVLDGKPVSGWRRSRVLSLAYEKALAEHSPVLALPGVRPEKLLSAVALLKDEQERLALSQNNVTEANLVRTSLYPIQFLQSAASLEEARQTFITTGNASDAARYRGLLKSTLDIYQRDLVRFRSAFQSVVPATTTAYGTNTYIIDYSGMSGALAVLEDGVAQMRSTLRMRLLCTHGMTIVCDRDNLHFADTPSLTQETVADPSMTTDVTNLYEAAGFPVSDAPSITLASSSCIPSNTPATFSFIRYGTSAADQYLTPLFTGDILFIKSALYGSAPFYQYFHDNGISYVPVDPLTYYECPETSHDFASALSVLEIIRFAKKYDLSQYLTYPDADTIRPLRNRLLGTTPHESDAVAYISGLRKVLPSTKETTSLHRTLDELSLAFSYKTAGLTELISTIVQFEGGNRLIAKHGVTFDTSARNLFYIRSGFGSLFLLTSPAVANSRISPFRVNRMTKSEKPYVQYSEIKTGPGIRTIIQKDMSFFWDTHIHL